MAIAKELILKKMIQSKLFEYMSLDDAEMLYGIAKHINYKAGEYIIKENEEGDEFYWILSGRVEIEITPPIDGRKSVHLNTLQEGDLLGEMVLLGKNRRTASARAHTDCEVVAWQCVDCFKVFGTDAHVGFRLMTNFAQILANRIHEMNLRMRNNTEELQTDMLRLLRST